MSSFTLQTSDCRLDCGCAQGMPLHNPSFLLIRDQVQPGSCFSSGSVRCNLARACVLSARVHCLLVAPCRRRFTAPHRARATCMTCTLTMPLASAFSCSLLRYVETSSVICPLNVPAQLIRWTSLARVRHPRPLRLERALRVSTGNHAIKGSCQRKLLR